MTVALMVITDGRWDYLEDTLASARLHLPYLFPHALVVDASGQKQAPTYFDGFSIAKSDEHLGMAEAIEFGWSHLPDADYVFHLEDDFTFPQSVDVDALVAKLQHYPRLAQVALKRQPWSPQEQQAGDMLCGLELDEHDGMCFHENLFTFNPCIYPRDITAYSVQGVRGAERELTDKLLRDGWNFAYYGTRDDPPRCQHIGHTRSARYRW